MALHGNTKIELTDVHTGRVETLEKGNFITNGIAEYNRPLGGLSDSYGLLSGTRITDYFGGLCLFNKALEGDENTFFPQGGATQVGAAEYAVTNTTSDTWLGSYNINESNIDYKAHTATFVYDFTTAQANGNIGAVCLAPKGCGAGGVWGISGGNAYGGVEVYNTGSNDFERHNTYVNPYTAQYDYVTNQIHPVFWDIENDVGYYINRTNLPYTLQKRRLYLQKASLFYDQRCTNTTLLEETELDFGVACDFSINGYDRYDATHFCVYGYKETSNTASGCAGKLYCFVFGLDGTLYKTITVESPCKKTRVADMSMGYLKGYLLIAGVVTEQDGTWPIYRVPENNPTDIQAAEIGMMSENVQRFFKFSLGETYYLYDSEYYGGGARRYRLLAYNVVSNRITLTNVLMPTLYFQGPLYPVGQRYRQIPIAGHDFWYMSGYDANGTYIKTNNGGWLYRVRMFLSTINNLSEPITKTADKTMKITYTITEVDE